MFLLNVIPIGTKVLGGMQFDNKTIKHVKAAAFHTLSPVIHLVSKRITFGDWVL